MEPILDTTWVSKNLRFDSPGAQGKKQTIRVLNERKEKEINKSSDKSTPNDILLCSQIGAPFILNMRSFFLGQRGTKTETHSQTFCRVRDLGTLRPKWNVSIKSLPSEMRQPCGRRGWKEHRSHRELGVNQENQVFQITISKYPASSPRLKQPAQGLHPQTTPGFCFDIMDSSLVFLWNS